MIHAVINLSYLSAVNTARKVYYDTGVLYHIFAKMQ